MKQSSNYMWVAERWQKTTPTEIGVPDKKCWTWCKWDRRVPQRGRNRGADGKDSALILEKSGILELPGKIKAKYYWKIIFPDKSLPLSFFLPLPPPFAVGKLSFLSTRARKQWCQLQRKASSRVAICQCHVIWGILGATVQKITGSSCGENGFHCFCQAGWI